MALESTVRAAMHKEPVPHTPTKQSRMIVRNLCCLGLDQDTIAAVLGIACDTVRHHYPVELRESKQLMLANVAGYLFRCALGEFGPKHAIPAAMFVLKTQAHWRETQRLELTGAEGQRLVDAPPQESYDQWVARQATKLLVGVNTHTNGITINGGVDTSDRSTD